LKRIAIFTNNFFPRLSGVSVAVSFLHTALKQQGYETMVVAPDYGYQRKVKGIEVFRVKSLYLIPMRMALPLTGYDEDAIRDVVGNWKPDLIHSNHPFLLGKAALELADEFHVPLVYTFHTLYEFFTHYFMLDTDTVRKAVREYVIRYTNHCDQVIAPTEPIRQYLLEIGVTAPVEAVPTGIDFSRFQKATPARVRGLRRKYDLKRFETVLLFVGRISKEKNVQLCLSTLAELVKRGKNAALLLLGEGPEAGALQSQARELQLSDRLILGGFLDQDTLAAAYFLGDLFLFPSLSDTQGIVLYEAQAAGLPVVATDSMASRAAVRPGVNGFFAEDDPMDFADKIEAVLASREKFREPFDTEAFSYDSLGRTYDRIYSGLIATGRKTDEQSIAPLARIFDEIRSLLA
jgi:glycosyltransferase involved in cell wall biosynthesis